MTKTTCPKCGHFGESMADAPGFCAQCGTLVAVMDTTRDAGHASRNAADPGPDAVHAESREKAESKAPMSRRMALWTAAACTLLQWALLVCFGFLGTVVSAFIHYNKPVTGYNKFTIGLVIGGVVATVICWIFAYRRHPFVGATIGAAAGMLVSVFCWWLAVTYY